MIAMVAVFGMFLLLFAFIGSVRGWAKEVLVIISVILALAVISLFEDLLNLEAILFNGNTTLQYWFRTLTVGLLVLFGYQSPSLPRLQKAIEKRGKIQDNILGFFFGIFSGYFVVGTLWSFSKSGYVSYAGQIRPGGTSRVERYYRPSPQPAASDVAG